ncbi:radical SAM protein [Campylobacter fetus subsp. testudinum]|uniref:Radical SAM protein n=2 Tax=Campylobacter fetus TaxID=196 RepID=A0AAX0HAJ7_CAMFE|nr:radical SAM/SPASM domain-containing protein [Campylobacter fetus]AVK81930.1 radical SAM/SPASM domain-containing protein [Campylobacter fetus subsp. testudinum]EAK0830669.1 radical SAM/SPASM domain-containing protein [Campylobacter fetus]MPB72027.1 radical SAM/SPASM domain-containing protein [Campylobacter fetus]MPB78175.1 radical SAM/SPASM domain-containing protein [Campylobacter fetus]OCR87518.1 radical SAM protein [Campylobacter fetus subsp. testudinum]
MFKKVYIEISDICSCKCSFCPSPLMETRRKTMSLELFERVLHQVSPLTKRICLHILGDPLEVSNLKEYINLVSKFDLKIDLVTTGKMLYKHSFDMLLEPPFHQISFSLSAFLDKNSKFSDDYVSNLLAFCSASLTKRSDTFINLRIQSDFLLNDDEKMSQTLDKFERYFDINLNKYLQHIKLNFAQKIYEKNVKIRLARKVLLNFKTSFEWRNNDLINITKTCYALKDQLGILSDGVVVPCCIDYLGAINLGNIKNESLAQILKSQRVKNIKNGFSQGRIVENYCQKCAYLVGVS